MHEYSLMERVMETLETRMREMTLQPGETLRAVGMEVGALELHSVESFNQAWVLQTKGTSLEGARLELNVSPARLRCQCGYDEPYSGDDEDVHNPEPYAECPTCGNVVRVTGGKGVGRIELTFGK
jgi:hydrogenase nickel incorporation protein HypA/HybF